jgi:predicted transcriptional regulator
MEFGGDELMRVNAMTPKEKIRAFVERMPDDVTMDQVFYKLELFIGVETGLQQIERGEYIDHDELFDELLKEDARRA